jgi:sugar phosphate isomerase/epimerase
MRLSCGDHSFPLLPHEKALSIIASLGFDGVNLIVWGNRSHVRPDKVQADIASWAGRIEERVRSRELEFADVVLIPWTDYEVLALNHPDARERKRSGALFRDLLDFTARLGAPGLTILPGVNWPHETHEKSLSRAAAELPSRIDEARERGIAFSIEPHIGSVCETPADVAWLCREVPGLQLTLDYTHFVVHGFTESEIEPLLRHTRHLHARGGSKGRLQAPLRLNTIDYERIVDVLLQQGYDGHIAVEYVWVEMDEMDEVDILSETVMMLPGLQYDRPEGRRDIPRLSVVREVLRPDRENAVQAFLHRRLSNSRVTVRQRVE